MISEEDYDWYRYLHNAAGKLTGCANTSAHTTICRSRMTIWNWVCCGDFSMDWMIRILII